MNENGIEFSIESSKDMVKYSLKTQTHTCGNDPYHSYFGPGTHIDEAKLFSEISQTQSLVDVNWYFRKIVYET